MSKYAIVFLCMLKEHYVVGACITAYIHKCFIKQLSMNIKLIIMCDDNIYDKYNHLLKLYFDRVVKLKLEYFPLSNKYNFAKEKYISWVSYATNKWQCLKFDEFNKILFLDIDMLPSKLEFYDIFRLNTPAVFPDKIARKIDTCNTLLNYDTGTSYADYVNNKFNFCGSIDGGIVLLSPSKKLYRQYKKFTHDIYKNGIYSRHESFPDEMSLFYFLSKQPGNAIYTICRKYSVIPWDFPDEASGALLYNFNSFYKPWIKGFAIQWDNERIWHYIYDILPYNETLDKLYNDSIRDHYNNTFLTLEPNIQKKRYNLNEVDLKKLDAINVNKKNNNEKKYGILDMKILGKCLNISDFSGGYSDTESEKVDTYPYRNKIYNENDKTRVFKNLIDYKLKFSHETVKPSVNINVPETMFLYKGCYYYITYQGSDYEKVQILSDFFNDNCRSACAFGNNITPIEYYNKNKQYLINSIKKSGKQVTDYNMREEIYNKMPMECSIHNPGIIKFFIEKYKAKRVLDLSAGWGDRLLGAMAAGVDLYQGIDPNPCLHPGYQNIIKTLLKYSPNPDGKYILIEDGSEKVKITEKDFDLVYTSPPYFDYEKYTIDSKQSHLTFNTQDTWLTNFLQVSIMKAINALRYGGHMVLYLAQERGKTYMEKFLKWMNSINDMYYMGAIHYADNKLRCPHPIFIYYKTYKIPSKLYNPKLTITEIIYNNIKLNVVRDDYIIGGTYTRACLALIKNILKNKAINKLIYSDIIHDSFILSVVYCLHLLKRPDIELIVYSNNGFDSIKQTLSYYHSNITFIHEKYKTKNSETAYIAGSKYKKILHKKLLKHLEKIKNKIKRLWLIIDSDTILYTLQKCLPYTHFLGIHVNSKHTDYAVYDSQRLKQYDGAVVDIISKYAENDDHIWYIDKNHKIFS